MMDYVLQIIIIMGVVEWVFGTLETSGIRINVAVFFAKKKGYKMLHKMITCDFCITWWITLIVFLFSLLIGNENMIWFIPFSAFGWYWILIKK